MEIFNMLIGKRRDWKVQGTSATSEVINLPERGRLFWRAQGRVTTSRFRASIDLLAIMGAARLLAAQPCVAGLQFLQVFNPTALSGKATAKIVAFPPACLAVSRLTNSRCGKATALRVG